MAASLTPNREAAKSALWWLFEGATIFVVLADTSAASPAPALDGELSNWAPYMLDSSYDVFLAGGIVSYDATLIERAELPPLTITLDYASSVTYTDLLIGCIPAVDPGASAPAYAFPLVAVIHESSAITLASTASKTYVVDLYSEWI